MNSFGNDSIWRESRASLGSTSSEKLLAAHARQTFLSMWSYSNVYTDEGRSGGKGDGKELCDQLVIFGNDVIIFSDKNCSFPAHDDIQIAWSRWYKKAIHKSAQQLAGAAAWIQKFPDRIYLDKNCTRRLPVAMPPLTELRLHLVAVTRGSRQAAQTYWDAMGKGSSSSLVIDTSITSDRHAKRPFCIGWQLSDRHCIHVLDELTLEVLMQELDTARDFIRYLGKKEELLSKVGMEYVVPGEEDLIAAYLMRSDSHASEPGFPEFPADTTVVMKEGSWQHLKGSRGYKARSKANRQSYHWDDLIEYQTEHIVQGTAAVHERQNSVANQEFILRRMAEESRLTRRTLSEAMQRAITTCGKGKRKMTAVLRGGGGRAYVFMALAHPKELSFEEYRDERQRALAGYCMGAHLRFPSIREVIGLGFEPKGSATFSVDFMCAIAPPEGLDASAKQEIEAGLQHDNMWQPGRVTGKSKRDRELPHSPTLLDRLIRRVRRT